MAFKGSTSSRLVAEALQLGQQALSGSSETPRLDAELLMAWTLKVDRVGLYRQLRDSLSEESCELFDTLVSRRRAQEPLAYITGVKEFMGQCFHVDRRVLIPRPETEHLVEWILSRIRQQLPGLSGVRVLDVGTGSGCIALSLCTMLEDVVDLEVEGWDVCVDALSVATKNREALGVSQTQVIFRHLDALAPVSWQTSKLFDVVAANPPYISEDERLDLPGSVVGWEPGKALFSGESGLRFYRMLAQHAGAVLKADGVLVVEIGCGQTASVSSLFQERGWANIDVLHDLASHERVLCFRKLRPNDGKQL